MRNNCCQFAPNIAKLGFSDDHIDSITEALDSLSGLTLVTDIAPMAIDGLTKVAEGITSTQELFEKCHFPGLLSERSSDVSEGAII